MKYFLPIVFSFISLSISAQDQCPCCTSYHQQFNFWLGDWNVYDTNGTLVGENTIVEQENHCLLNEHWRGAKGTTGRSYNYYNSKDSTWNQLWIDNNGGQLILKGTAIENGMLLKSAVVSTPKGNYYNQITWTKNNDGSVTQLWQYFDEENNLIKTAFKGIYKRK